MGSGEPGHKGLQEQGHGRGFACQEGVTVCCESVFHVACCGS